MKITKLIPMLGALILCMMMLLMTSCSTSSEKTSGDKAKAGEITTAQGENKNNGQASLAFQGAFFVSVESNKSTDLGKVDAGTSNKAVTVKLVFDRGIVKDNWESNQKQIKLQSKDGSVIESEVFRLDGDAEKSNIFVKPLKELKAGDTVTIVIGKDLKANNGNVLGKEEKVSFTVK